MDAFFASVEQRDFPELKGKAIVVGGSKNRGVVAAASYEARKFGVKSAMSSRLALKKCPHLIFRKTRFEAYKKVSQQIHEIFQQYTDIIEPLSLDEAYLDVTENKKGIKSATVIAQQIRKDIKKQTLLTASAGISSNKFVAKIASDVNKPDGYCLVPPAEIEQFLEVLPISKFHGIGKVTAKKLNSFGTIVGRDLKKMTLEFLIQNFGKQGQHFHQIVRGIDHRKVNPHRMRKSVGTEDTFDKDLYLPQDLSLKLSQICQRLSHRLDKSPKKAKTLTLKVKFSDFTQITRSHTIPSDSGICFESLFQIQQTADRLLGEVEIPKTGIRLLGVSVSNFLLEDKVNAPTQLTLNF